eukprot:COSAG04_NODE_2181_length_4607_cov_19.522099_8_plen_164_part_01
MLCRDRCGCAGLEQAGATRIRQMTALRIRPPRHGCACPTAACCSCSGLGTPSRCRRSPVSCNVLEPTTALPCAENLRVSRVRTDGLNFDSFRVLDTTSLSALSSSSHFAAAIAPDKWQQGLVCRPIPAELSPQQLTKTRAQHQSCGAGNGVGGGCGRGNRRASG